MVIIALTKVDLYCYFVHFHLIFVSEINTCHCFVNMIRNIIWDRRYYNIILNPSFHNLQYIICTWQQLLSLNFQRVTRTLLFGDSQEDQAQNIMSANAVQTFIKNSRSFTEGTYPPPILFNCYFFYIINAYILIIRHALRQTYVYRILGRTFYKL